MNDLQNQVKSIIEYLECPPMNCEECSEEFTLDDNECCPECGSTDYREVSGWEYIGDALDIEHTVGSDGGYLGSRILVCFGGPNIWVDTRTNRVDGHWWQDSYSEGFTDEIGLGEEAEELFACLEIKP